MAQSIQCMQELFLVLFHGTIVFYESRDFCRYQGGFPASGNGGRTVRECRAHNSRAFHPSWSSTWHGIPCSQFWRGDLRLEAQTIFEVACEEGDGDGEDEVAEGEGEEALEGAEGGGIDLLGGQGKFADAEDGKQG